MATYQYLAHRYVATAIEFGQLPALDGSIACVDCGKVATIYDHRDYALPLDVSPVCSGCNVLRGTAKNHLHKPPKVRCILARARITKSMTQFQLSAAIGKDPHYVSRLETKRVRITEAVAQKIAPILGLPVSVVLNGADLESAV